jgi:hypothetical protein
MKTKKTPDEIWAEYQRGLDFNRADPLNLTETVQRNENFYNGRQWIGLDAPNLDKPVFNILKRVVTFFISSIVSDDIAVSVSEFTASSGGKQVLDMLSGQFGEVMELSGFKRKGRDVVRDAAVDGDGCIHYYFDPGAPGEDEDEAQPDGKAAPTETPGTIQAEILDNVNVFFGNPQETDIQKQPYVIVQFRRFVEDVKELVGPGAAEAIQPDADESGVNTASEKDDGSRKVTVLRKYYKEKGVVHYIETTKDTVVREEARLGYRLYPLGWFAWEKVKNQYHGQAALTGLLPNQIFINKLFAMAMEHVKRMAFPKVVYNKSLLPNGWSNKVGAAIGVNGPPTDVVSNALNPPDMSNQVLLMVDKVINYTRDTMGASDAALGNIKPDNTSAIIATQKATAMPLELQKMGFYQLVEDSVRIWLEMMGEHYGVRAVEMNLAKQDPPQVGMLPETLPMAPAYVMPAGVSEVLEESAEGGSQLVMFDFSTLKGMNLRLNVDIGASTYWSELMQVQTLDNLYERGIITDPEVYLEMIPAPYIQNKHILLEAVRKQKAQAEEMAAAQSMGGQAESAIPAELGPLLDGGGMPEGMVM